MKYRIGVDVGGTNLRVGVVNGLKIIEQSRRSTEFSATCHANTPNTACQKIIHSLADTLSGVLQRFPEAAAIGIGFPGFIDPLSGRISQSPNLPGLRDVDLGAALTEVLQRPVTVVNDALAAAYGEQQLMLATADLIYVGLGTGVGGGLIVNHQPFPGQHGVAMEIGHLIVEHAGRLCGCGNHGCMEQYASATGVSATYQSLTSEQLAASEIAARARQGDQHAQYAFHLAAECLAQALAHTLKVLDVTTVVIGGGMSRAWPLMASSFHRRLEQDLIPTLRNRIRLTVSSHVDQVGVLGAALLAATAQ